MQLLCLGLLLTYSFDLCFNDTTRQANFVKYIQNVNGGCESTYLRQEPINAILSADYTGNGVYDRGHLVPNADYGCESNIMGNILPMKAEFNRGTWAIMEREIRNKYPGKLIVKGPKYNDQENNIKMQNDIDVPVGFYWLVFDEDKLIENGFIDQFTNVITKELPYWIDGTNNDLRNSSLFVPIMVIVPTVFLLCVVLPCIIHRYSKKKQTTIIIDDVETSSDLDEDNSNSS
jgi:hypothetical protein